VDTNDLSKWLMNQVTNQLISSQPFPSSWRTAVGRKRLAPFDSGSCTNGDDQQETLELELDDLEIVWQAVDLLFDCLLAAAQAEEPPEKRRHVWW
jgi:hypothetical protein